MKESYLKHYKNISALFPLSLSWAALTERSSLRKLALMNRQKDYAALTQTPKLLELHYKINRHLLKAADEWPHYDYGEGYFYQGLDSIGVRGFRDTRARMNVMNLSDAVDDWAIANGRIGYNPFTQVKEERSADKEPDRAENAKPDNEGEG